MELTYTDSAGLQTAVSDIANFSAVESESAVPPPISIKVLDVTDAPYNVRENGEAGENGAGLAACYRDARAQGAQVEIPPGRYVYSGTLIHDSITVFNDGELVGVDADSGYCMKGADPRLVGGVLAHEGLTVRGSQMNHHGIGLYDQTGTFEIIDVTVRNPAAAGICIWDGRNGRILGCTVEDCLADGMHHVSSGDGVSGHIYERGNTVRRCGDDCLSFVTYMINANVVHDVDVYNFRGEDNTWGRGITIQGAERINIWTAQLNRIKCFGIYCGIEQNYGTVSKAVLHDVKLDVCGQWSSGADTQDGVLISGWTSTTVCELHDVVISRPMRHGVLRYHESGNTFVADNVIYHEIAGQEVYNVPSGKEHEPYVYPARFARFVGPRGE